MKTFAVHTLGCKVNQVESEALAEALSAHGMLPAGLGEAPDVVVVNTCTVTHRSERDARTLVRRAQRAHPGARVVVTGCAAEIDPATFVSLGAHLVVGAAGKESLADLVVAGKSGIVKDAPGHARPLAPLPTAGERKRRRAFFKVQDGCEARCAYCIVPLARGPSRSLPPDAVQAGLERLRQGGRREVVLTGIHVGMWGHDLTPRSDFDFLLQLAENSGIPRIRISSLEPLEVSDFLLERLARAENLCPHLHIPLQSGCDAVLRRMGRPYGAGEFRRRVEAAFTKVDGLCLGLDVIVGFPGETDDEFRQTLELLESLPLAYLHVFPFSRRKGTVADAMDAQVPEPVKKARAAQLRELSEAKRRSFYTAQVGKTAQALPERLLAGGRLRARTRNYAEVDLPWSGALPEDELRVRLVGFDGQRLVGEAP